MTTRPLVTLKKHLSGVVDVVIFENQRLFLSCSRDAVIYFIVVLIYLSIAYLIAGA